MTATVLKQAITELTREGCLVERLAHNPAVVTFRSPDGSRLALAADEYSFALAPVVDGPERFGPTARYGSLRDAIRAACCG